MYIWRPICKCIYIYVYIYIYIYMCVCVCVCKCVCMYVCVCVCMCMFMENKMAPENASYATKISFFSSLSITLFFNAFAIHFELIRNNGGRVTPTLRRRCYLFVICRLAVVRHDDLNTTHILNLR